MRFTVEPVNEEPEGSSKEKVENAHLELKPLNEKIPNSEANSKGESIKQPLLVENNNEEVTVKEANVESSKRGLRHQVLSRTLSVDTSWSKQVTDSFTDSVSASPTTSQVDYNTKYLDSVKHAGENYGRSKQNAKERLFGKGGDVNLSHVNFESRSMNFFIDIFTTLVDMKWRYNILMFAMGFLITWIGFALIWWIILLVHGDHLHVDDADWTPCMAEVYDFTTALLFSLETQHTIGYGSRSMHPGCPPAIITLMVQSCTGVFVQSLMTGVIFAKLARPKRRSYTIVFSQNAVICLRDGEYCLLFRVGDMRSQSLIINASVRAILFKGRKTIEQEEMPLCQHPIEVQTETNNDSYAFMVAPVTVVHKIDKNSPFWDISENNILAEKFEIVVILEGTVESTGMTTQLRTSYLPNEIKWGHILKPLVTCKKGKGYVIDHGLFHQTDNQDGMPSESAKDHHETCEETRSIRRMKVEPVVNFTLPTKLTRSASTGRFRKIVKLMTRRSHSTGASVMNASPSNGRFSKSSSIGAKLSGKLHAGPY